ncbi:YbaB/EbfC DNA-binding family protein [Asanoa hainanensis]|uniref:YbaB/EbfC DNA-binding family protein n=1 Tax=Asanoa hainanensis TaxID=560556 RepID=A0A239H6E4_9ACTN|nr:YbaB/EbfC family nucleoid-associated protein [Asanoa hainanensis]SNS76741.1 YbaB/EbfC DNA-binding family protein [Asanoa hainanensis]
MDNARLEDLDRSIRETEQRMRGLGDLQRTLEETRATYATESGLVTLVLGADQVVHGVELHPAAMRLAPEELASEIKAAFAGAQAELARVVNLAMAGVLGTESPEEVLENAAGLEHTMTDTLSELTRSMNDAIVAVSRLQSRS